MLNPYLFADDTTLIASHVDFEFLLNFVNNEFRKVCLYFRKHGLALNAKKTNFMIFSNSPTIRNRNCQIFINNNNPNENNPDFLIPIEQINSQSKQPYIKFLGVLFDQDLSFKHQIQHVSNQMSKGIYFLRACKNMFSEFCLKTIYYTMIHSYLTYALPIWSCTPSTSLNTIVKKQKISVRLICNTRHNSHTEPLFKKLGILPFSKLIDYFNLNFIHDYIYGFLPSSYINYWPTNRDQRNATENDFELRNDYELYCPPSRLKSSEYFPYFKLPRIWINFDSANPMISIIRDKCKFKQSLKKFFLDNLNSDYRCDRLFCPTCSQLP